MTLAQIIAGVGIEGATVPIKQRTAFRGAWHEGSGHVQFTLSSPKAGEYVGEYSAGCGAIRAWAIEHPAKALPFMNRGQYLAALKQANWRVSLSMEALEYARMRWEPGLEDILASILMDSANYEPGMTFREWLDRDGLKWEHPADALEAYRAIERSGRWVLRAFGERYREALELAQER